MPFKSSGCISESPRLERESVYAIALFCRQLSGFHETGIAYRSIVCRVEIFSTWAALKPEISMLVWRYTMRERLMLESESTFLFVMRNRCRLVSLYALAINLVGLNMASIVQWSLCKK